MGSLTTFLQSESVRKCSAGWACRPEHALLPRSLAKRLGYQARADVLLEEEDNSHRLWIEFEVSRADPVANHAKFTTSHLFEPQRGTDCFLAMVSPHITRGRRNARTPASATPGQGGGSAAWGTLRAALSRDEGCRNGVRRRCSSVTIGVRDRHGGARQGLWPSYSGNPSCDALSNNGVYQRYQA